MKWTGWSLPLIVLVLAASSLTAQEEAKEVKETKTQNEVITEEAQPQSNKIAISLTYGSFTPTSSSVRDTYSDSWTRVGLRSFDPNLPKKWRFVGEIGSLSVSGDSDISIVPMTAGVERGFKEFKKFQPYVTMKTGPYFGKVDNNLTGEDSSRVGWAANAAYGITYRKTFYIEARYDYLTELADSNFSGFSLSIGTRLFDLRL